MLHAFIDESGGRGLTPNSTDHFIVSAVVVRDTNMHRVGPLLNGLRTDLSKPEGSYLTWKNIRNHADRVHIAQEIGAQEWLKVISVVACKRHLPKTGMSQSHIYLYQMRFLLERLSWLARSSREVSSYTLAHIRHFRLEDLREYEKRLAADSNCQIHWPALDPSGGVIDQPQRLEELQLADLAVSAIAPAFNPDRWGNTEPRYLSFIAPRLYRHSSSPLTSYGLKMHPWGETTKAAYPWVATL